MPIDRLLTFPVCVPRICLKNRDFSCGAALGCAIKYLIYFLLLCMPPETSLLRQKRKIPWKELWNYMVRLEIWVPGLWAVRRKHCTWTGKVWIYFWNPHFWKEVYDSCLRIQKPSWSGEMETLTLRCGIWKVGRNEFEWPWGTGCIRELQVLSQQESLPKWTRT